jgi:hypothetical protein
MDIRWGGLGRARCPGGCRFTVDLKKAASSSGCLAATLRVGEMPTLSLDDPDTLCPAERNRRQLSARRANSPVPTSMSELTPILLHPHAFDADADHPANSRTIACGRVSHDLRPPLRFTGSAAAEAALFARLLLHQVRPSFLLSGNRHHERSLRSIGRPRWRPWSGPRP